MNSPRRPSPAKHQAFTLIELLTVIAIIGILAAIIIPTVGSVRSSARSAQALNNAKQIGMANLLYAQENRTELIGLGADGNSIVAQVFNRMTTYLQKNPGGNLENTANVLLNVVDPAVPLQFRDYNASTAVKVPWTWSINVIFNTSYGRSRHLGSGAATPRRLSEFQDPSRIIYAVGGGYEARVEDVQNAAFLDQTTRSRVMYYHRGGRASPAVFLDGHTQMLTYPIDPKLINPLTP